MTKKIINIRLEEAVWQQAKISAATQGMTLQGWLTIAILKMAIEESKQR